MSELRDFLENIDDEYLIGLTNKGIVKRSYKDLENDRVEISEQGEQLSGSIGEIKVQLKLPLTDSTCTCPAGSLCKHIIMAIITAKQEGGIQQTGAGEAQSSAQQAGAGEAQSSAQQAGGGQTQNSVQEAGVGEAQSNAQQTGVGQTQGSTGESKKEAKVSEPETNAKATFEENGRENAEAESIPDKKSAPKAPQASGTGDAPAAAKTDTLTQLQELTLQELRKNAAAREWKESILLVLNKKPEKIEEGKLLTVSGEDGLSVKLAWPLSLSTCGICHNDKLCRHKLWAVLSYQIQKEKLSYSELMDEQEEDGETFDDQRAGEVLSDIRKLLCEILFVGCARLSPETPYGLERLAIRCHNAGLAVLEGRMRTLAEQAKGYQERRARVTAGGLLQKISQCYSLTIRTQKVLENGEKASALIGAFRTEYNDLPKLQLLGLGMRWYVSDAGYEGSILYFLEEKSRIFYTYTDVRPTFYDKNHRSSYAKAAVPWELPCTLVQLSKARITLKKGRANRQRRLSATSQAEAELIELDAKLPDHLQEMLYDDFESLWEAYQKRLTAYGADEGADNGRLPEAERLFLIRPRSICEMRYDETAQRLVFYLEDIVGRRLRAQIAYSKQEEAAIKYLEKMQRRLEKENEEPPAFFGALYVDDGECILYPIETVT